MDDSRSGGTGRLTLSPHDHIIDPDEAFRSPEEQSKTSIMARPQVDIRNGPSSVLGNRILNISTANVDFVDRVGEDPLPDRSFPTCATGTAEGCIAAQLQATECAISQFKPEGSLIGELGIQSYIAYAN